MPTNIFSTYSTAENRVTASLLAVLRSLSLDRMERLVAALLEQSEFELVRFQNQPSKGGQSVPDAVISSSCRLLFETKIKRNSANEKQLRGHLTRLDKATEKNRVLVLLTPDETQPAIVDAINDERLVWSSFVALDQSIGELLDDKMEVVSEREAFLLRELQAMFLREKLLASAKDVLVVPARHAWPEYQQHHAYICQAERTFRPVKRMAFYVDGKIQTAVPRIREVFEQVELQPGEHTGELGQLIDALVSDPRALKTVGDVQKIILLTAPGDPDTLNLDAPILNDLESKTGQVTAFTQNQRYVSSKKLLVARTTSALVDS